MTLSPLMSRLAALGILGALLAIGWLAFFAPLIDGIVVDRAALARSDDLLARYDQLAREEPVLQERLAALRNSGWERNLLAGPNAALVSAKLQSDVQQIAGSARISLRNSQTMPARTEGGFTRIGLQLEFGADPETLLALLYGIESSTPALFVDDLAIRAPETPASLPAGAQLLSVRLEIAAFMRKPTS